MRELITATILTIALNLPTNQKDENFYPTSREQWLIDVSHAIERASNRVTNVDRTWPGTQRELAVALIVLASYESNLSPRIQAGKCHAHECDAWVFNNGTIWHRAASMWQLHASDALPEERWKQIVGTDVFSIERAAYEAARMLAKSRNQCKRYAQERNMSWVTGMFSAYATGAKCEWIGAFERTTRYQNVLWITPSSQALNLVEHK